MLLSTSMCAPLASEDLPSNFYITERALSLVETFDLESDSKKIGSIAKRIFSLTTTFDFLGPASEKIARASAEFFSLGTIAHVYDASDREIGWIEESLFTWVSPAKYRIFDHTNRLVAIARMNFWGNKFVVCDPTSQKEIAIIHRPWLRFFRDAWTVELLDPKAMDPRLMVFVATYQTDAEARARERKAARKKEWELESRNGISSFFPLKKETQALLFELDGFDFLSDDQILERWKEHEKEYEAKLLPFSSKVLLALFSQSQKAEKERSLPILQKEFDRQYARLQTNFFLESLREGIQMLKDPKVKEEDKKILYNALKEIKRERV
jgi:hypothetical protein